MKRFFKILAVMTALSIAFVSCDDDDDVINDSTGQEDGTGEDDDFGADVETTHDSLSVVYFGDVLEYYGEEETWAGANVYTVVIGNHSAGFKISSIAEGYPDDFENIDFVYGEDYYAFFLFSEAEVSGDEFAIPEGTYTIFSMGGGDEEESTGNSPNTAFGLCVNAESADIDYYDAMKSLFVSGTLTVQEQNGKNIVTVSAVAATLDDNGDIATTQTVSLAAVGKPRSTNMSITSMLTSDVALDFASATSNLYFTEDEYGTGCNEWSLIFSYSSTYIAIRIVSANGSTDGIPTGKFTGAKTGADGTYMMGASYYEVYENVVDENGDNVTVTTNYTTFGSGSVTITATETAGEYTVDIDCYDDAEKYKITGTWTGTLSL